MNPEKAVVRCLFSFAQAYGHETVSDYSQPLHRRVFHFLFLWRGGWMSKYFWNRMPGLFICCSFIGLFIGESLMLEVVRREPAFLWRDFDSRLIGQPSISRTFLFDFLFIGEVARGLVQNNSPRERTSPKEVNSTLWLGRTLHFVSFCPTAGEVQDQPSRAYVRPSKVKSSILQRSEEQERKISKLQSLITLSFNFFQAAVSFCFIL